jgi:hypothetical protein
MIILALIVSVMLLALSGAFAWMGYEVWKGKVESKIGSVFMWLMSLSILAFGILLWI